MPARIHLSLVLVLLAAAAAEASTLPFRTHFGLDTVGLPPAVGGPGQPTGLQVPAGSSATVVDGFLGLEGQPVALDSPSGDATWLSWSVSPAVSDLGLEVRFSISFASAYSGTFFDLSGPGGVRARLGSTTTGELRVGNGCAFSTLGEYAPGTPVPVVVQFAPPASYWVIADVENDGFDDDTPVAGESCNPGNISTLAAYAWSFVDQAVAVAFDDLVATWLPIFVDDFETGDTGLWTLSEP